MIRVNGKIKIPHSKQKTLNYLWDIQQIANYELKVDRVKVEKTTEREGHYKPRGRFAGLPWKGLFSYKLTDNGFVSDLLKGPIKGVKVHGGFSVRETGSDSCEVTHFENYTLPWPYKVVAPVFAGYIKWSIRKELQIIRDSVA